MAKNTPTPNPRRANPKRPSSPRSRFVAVEKVKGKPQFARSDSPRARKARTLKTRRQDRRAMQLRNRGR